MVATENVAELHHERIIVVISVMCEIGHRDSGNLASGNWLKKIFGTVQVLVDIH